MAESARSAASSVSPPGHTGPVADNNPDENDGKDALIDQLKAEVNSLQVENAKLLAEKVALVGEKEREKNRADDMAKVAEAHHAYIVRMGHELV
ncbi:hypothetical protein HMPREF1624_05652 [Sporothrix schenckii ATCC 58251]|uniref:Uncharacterized protein n=1 Tax=Sporothrix schenckii (strain ATCC 58251 / de Perez 2211183) TaxID=1391915 RepID=U7PRX9_SPOS1|nr:hypothetical protein HMPREF1624_05652 [Sporothrix schenckii ATCC 58251]